MNNQIKELELLASIINKDELSESVSMLKNSNAFDNNLLLDVTTHAVKRIISRESISLNLLLDNPALLKPVGYLSKFDIYSSEETMKNCNSMFSDALDSFHFLSKAPVESGLESIYNALLEYTQMSFSSYPTYCDSTKVVRTFHDKELKASSSFDAIEKLNGEPFGFYLFCITASLDTNYVDNTHKNIRYIVSHQSNGDFFGGFSVEKKRGLSLLSKNSFTNPFFSRRIHARSEESKEIALIKDKDSLYHSFSQKTLYGISFICSLMAKNHHLIFDYEVKKKIMSFNSDSSNQVTKLDSITESVSAFTLEDLKFQGDFECLSFYDDIYSEKLEKDIDLINFHRKDDCGKVFVIHYNNPHSSNPDGYNIHERCAVEGINGYRGNHPILRSIPKLSSFNSSEAGKDRLRLFAIQNKISLIRLYESKTSLEDIKLAMDELQALAINSIEYMIDLASTKQTIWTSGGTKRWHDDFGSRSNILASKNYALSRKIKGHENEYGDFNNNLRNYNDKSKASHVVYYEVSTIEEILNIAGTEIENLPASLKRLCYFVQASNALIKHGKENNLMPLSASDMDYTISRPEMSFAFTFKLFKVGIPLSKSQFEKLLNKDTETKRNVLKMY